MGVESTVTDLVPIHLKDINIWEIWVPEKLSQMEVGAEGVPLAIQVNGVAVGYDRLVRMPEKSGDPGGKNFYGRVIQLPQTGRLWVVDGMKEDKKAVMRNIKPNGGVIDHGVEFSRVIENGW